LDWGNSTGGKTRQVVGVVKLELEMDTSVDGHETRKEKNQFRELWAVKPTPTKEVRLEETVPQKESVVLVGSRVKGLKYEHKSQRPMACPESSLLADTGRTLRYKERHQCQGHPSRNTRGNMYGAGLIANKYWANAYRIVVGLSWVCEKKGGGGGYTGST